MTKPNATTTSSQPVAPDTIADSVQAFIEQGAQTLGTIKSQVSAIIDVTQRGSKLADRVTALVQQRPLTSVAAALGLGAVTRWVMTSALTPLALVGGLLYLGTRPSATRPSRG
jgi:hypothetical protein